MTIGLVVGDCAGLKYNRQETIYFECNVSKYRLEESYKKGVELSGLDITDTCFNYEDRRIPAKFFAKFKIMFPGSSIVTHIEEELEALGDDEYLPTPQEFAEIYMMVAQLGNPSLDYQESCIDTIDIGGFSLLL